jgi:hypothetical protein
MPETKIKIKVELPSSSDLFKKHFNEVGIVNTLHPNMEFFFEELNQVCLIEDSLKKINTKN